MSDTTSERRQSSATYRRRWRNWRRAPKQRDTVLRTCVAAPRSLAVSKDCHVTNNADRVNVSSSGWLGSCDNLRVDVHHINTVLSALSWSRFELIQPDAWLTHSVISYDRAEVAAGRQQPYIWLSSAYWCSKSPCSATISAEPAV